MATPVGIIELGVDGGDLVALRFVGRSDAPPGDLSGVAGTLAAYFGGDLDALESIPVRFDRGTPFQRDVWAALRSIPRGTTISYAALADRVGRPGAFRAVGTANGRNPIALVVPCHRVVHAGGGLGGYAVGLDRKQWLLDHERGRIAPELTTSRLVREPGA